MDDLLTFLVARVDEDLHTYAYVAGTFGGDALLDSHLPMLDLINILVSDYRNLEPQDARTQGLAHALRTLAQSYAEHPGYRQEWRP